MIRSALVARYFSRNFRDFIRIVLFVSVERDDRCILLEGVPKAALQGSAFALIGDLIDDQRAGLAGNVGCPILRSVVYHHHLDVPLCARNYVPHENGRRCTRGSRQ